MIKRFQPVVGLLAGLAAALSLPAFAALTDLSSSPLASTTSAQVKPNIMLLMDTSGSMGWGHMPDEVESVTGVTSIGYKSAQCNVLYYNPNQAYQIPKKYDGTFFATPSFNAAPYAGFVSYYASPDSTDTSVVNLATSFQAYDSKTLRTPTHTTRADGGDGDTPQAAYYYTYSGSQTLSYKSAPCTDPDTGVGNAATGGGNWTRVVVSSTSAANQANFAVWYSFYRTRISLIKSAASLAFTPLTDTFRVGFLTVFPKTNSTDTSINTANYLPIGDFNSTQRNAWFSKLFSQSPRGSSPAREGLARVGRMYAGKHDGINAGMTDDPVQYSCQQNFAIMTTDGYWNTQDESPNGGPVKIDGTTPVGQQDGTLVPITVDPNSLTPRPIWDGTIDGTAIVDNYTNAYSYAACGSFAYESTVQHLQSTTQASMSTTQMTQSTTQQLQSTAQNLQSTAQNLQSTTQTTKSTAQQLQSTAQDLQSTAQHLQSTTQTTQSTSQALQSTNQNRRSTSQNVKNTSQTTQTTTQATQTQTVIQRSTTQNLRSTSQTVQSTSQPTQSTSQLLQSTNQNLQSTTQTLQSTSQLQQQTSQLLQSTSQSLRSTSQTLASTTQTTRSTAQVTQSTAQNLQSTTQTRVTTTQVQRASSQTESCDAHTESCTYVPPGTCTPSRYISCNTTTTGPTLVASCTAQSAAPGNNYLQVTCTPNSTGPTGAASCTAQTASASNNYTTTTCDTVATSNVPVGSCTPQTASAGNTYTTTTCSTATTGPTGVASCTPTAASTSNNYTQTTCGNANTGPTPVASCAASGPTAGNGYTTTTCGSNNTTNVPSASCTPATASGSNNYTATTCGTATTGPTAVASCTPATASSSNSYTATTCGTATTGPTGVASCTPVAASGSNNYTATTCNTATTGPTGVASCTPVAASGSNSYTATTCNTATTPATGVASCTPVTAGASNNYTTTSCSSSNTTNVPVASCTPSSANSGNSYTATTCPSPVTTTNVPVASCAPAAASSGNSYTSTTCTTATTGPTVVASCTPVSASASNNYTATTCGSNTTTNVPVASCAPSGPTASNNYTTTTCPAPITTTSVPVASCTPSSAASGNSYTTTTCATNNTSNVAVASCSPATASSSNGYTTTTCASNVTGPTVVASCSPSSASASNGYTTTTCGNNTNTTASGNCVPSSASSSNGYTTTTCGTVTHNNVPVQTCTPSSASASNNWTATTCPGPITTTNVPVATCSPSSASSSNNWTTTTCPAAVTTTNVPVASCTPATASSTNSYTTTTCSTPTTPATGVASCTPVAASASNNYTATTCTPNNTTNVAVASCSPSGPTSGNGYTTTTCTTNDTSNVAVASCSPSGPSSSNGYTTTTCSTSNTTNVAVASCSSSSPTSTNGYTTTTCSTATTGPTGVASCTPVAASSSNNYTATTCAPNNAANVGVASCSPSGPSSSNGYTTTTCSTSNTTNVAVASCSSSSPTSTNGYTTTTCSTSNTTNVGVASCTPSSATGSNSYTTTTCSAATTGPTGVASCTPVAASSSNNYTATTCAPNNTVSVAVASCSPSGPTAANHYTTTNCSTSNTSDVAVESCSPSSPTTGNGYTTTSCRDQTTGPIYHDQGGGSPCIPASASASNTWTQTTCAAATGKQLQYTTTHSRSSQSFSGGRAVAAPTVTTDSPTGPTLIGACYRPGNLPTDPGIEPEPPVPPSPEPLPAPPAGCSGWPCTVTQNAGSGSTNALADVAQYYYATDLRPSADWSPAIASDNVPSVGTGAEDDRVNWQHMTTFTIGLGVSGTLNYQPDYLSAVTGDFASIRSGISTTNADGTPTATTWPLWPDPAVDYNNFNNWNNPKSIDDFWHTAVNGRGKYFSAGNPTSVIAGLSGALVGVQARLSSGAAAGLSTAQPIQGGDNRVYVSLYTTSDWTGDVQAHDTDLTTGLPSTQFWSAQALLDAKTGAACDGRSIYLIHNGSSLVNFSTGSIARCDGTFDTSTGLDAGERANFGSADAQLLSQWPSMSASQQSAAPGTNLVNFLRGQRGLEGFTAGDATKLYRTRRHVLGDVVDAQPVVVKSPSFGYADAGYGQFVVDNANRTPMVYVAANDGMLHAFYAGTSSTDVLGGQEAWAVVPSTVLPLLYRLADDNYRNVHQFSVDGTPVVADVHGSGGWRTILVGGLNDGGKGYYALDVTDPATPRALWEFKGGGTCHAASEIGYTSDCYLGYSYGKPVISKLANGTWVVMFSSGYNNVVGGSGDGQGYLYIVDATTGAVISRTSTGVGTAAAPSGLAQINNYVENGAVDNTTIHVYGGDLLGNIWRFEVDGTPTATRLGTAKDSSGFVQSITVRPELAELNGKPMVLVGTGRLLGPSDLGNLQVQSIYGIVDQLSGNPVYTDLRGSLAPLTMTLSADGQSRTIACTGSGAACGSPNGWVADFPDGTGGNPTGERVNIDMRLASSTLVIGSNVPQNDACSTGGYSWLTSLDFSTGLAVTSGGTAIVSSVASSNSLLGGFNVVSLPSGSYQASGELVGRTGSSTVGGGGSGGGGPCVNQPGEVNCQVPINQSTPPTKRISWREIRQ